MLLRRLILRRQIRSNPMHICNLRTKTSKNNVLRKILRRRPHLDIERAVDFCAPQRRLSVLRRFATPPALSGVSSLCKLAPGLWSGAFCLRRGGLRHNVLPCSEDWLVSDTRIVVKPIGCRSACRIARRGCGATRLRRALRRGAPYPPVGARTPMYGLRSARRHKARD